MTISSAIAKALPAAESVRKWRPSLGHVYQLPSNTTATRPKLQDSKEATPMPDEAVKTAAQKSDELSLERLAEESLMIHMKYGGEYIDENPITGRPGEFHLSSTGRKAVPPPQLSKQEGIGPMGVPTLNTKLDDANKKDEKSPKTPRSAAPKPKRRKSKMSTSTPMAS
jgi:mediator of RNA polymerase II transcription subunit 6